MCLENRVRRRKSSIRAQETGQVKKLLFFFIFLIFILSFPAHSSSLQPDSSGPRKVQFFPAALHGTRSVEAKKLMGSNSEDKFYDEDKRLVRTGPNPLHN
ncbi:CLAVATA3/ESR (CLE)-related protein 16-like [Impatiens glandulifera]|uniref:CLAVATA3/ESR (CLE)-related protein 16-like n=1 Tax=Impatiens glandulifera TaxID=253017 RepID=UPI001FB06ADE|nr:CLAVATA3/ESR (CLE)-related protein 16-like [Impatiens glandulifera]